MKEVFLFYNKNVKRKSISIIFFASVLSRMKIIEKKWGNCYILFILPSFFSLRFHCYIKADISFMREKIYKIYADGVHLK